MAKRKIALYECVQCKKRFKWLQGGGEHPPPEGCIMCGHLYLDWLNFDEVSNR